MDLYCQRCGEPWDFWSAKPEAAGGDMTSEEATRLKAGIDCPACHGKEMCSKNIRCQECEDRLETTGGYFRCGKDLVRKPFRAQLASALADILGDDVDGLAAEMEDAEYVLGGEFWD